MLIGIFKTKHPFTYLLLLVYSFLLFGILYFWKEIHLHTEYSILTDAFPIDLSIIPQNWLITISILITFIFSILFHQTLNHFNIFNDQSLLPAFMFITITAIYPEMILLSPSSISIFISMIVISNLCRASDMDNAVQSLFYTSFIVALGSMIYSPVAFHIVLIIFLLPFIKTLKGRELLIIPIGFIIPFYLAGFYYFFTDDLQGYFNLILENLPGFTLPLSDKNLLYAVPSGFIGLLFLISYFRYRFQLRTKTIRIIIYNRILLNYAIFSSMFYFFMADYRWTIGYYVIASYTPFISNMLSDDSYERFNQILFSILLVFTVFYQWIFYSY